MESHHTVSFRPAELLGWILGYSLMVTRGRGAGATYGEGDSYALHLLYVLQPNIDTKEGLAGGWNHFISPLVLVQLK